MGLSFDQRSSTECGVYECEYEVSSRPWPKMGCCAMEEIIVP